MNDDTAGLANLVDQDLRDLQWRVALSFAYHRKRERFLDGADRCANAISALAGAGAFATIVAEWSGIGLAASAIVALTSTLVLVYGPAATARRHAELARDFKKLEADMCSAGPAHTAKQHYEFKARALNLEASEPPQLGALVTQCHNEMTTAENHKAVIERLPFFQRLFMNWFDFDQSRVEPPKVAWSPRTRLFFLGLIGVLALALGGFLPALRLLVLQTLQ